METLEQLIERKAIVEADITRKKADCMAISKMINEATNEQERNQLKADWNAASQAVRRQTDNLFGINWDIKRLSW